MYVINQTGIFTNNEKAEITIYKRGDRHLFAILSTELVVMKLVEEKKTMSKTIAMLHKTKHILYIHLILNIQM